MPAVRATRRPGWPARRARRTHPSAVRAPAGGPANRHRNHQSWPSSRSSGGRRPPRRRGRPPATVPGTAAGIQREARALRGRPGPDRGPGRRRRARPVAAASRSTARRGAVSPPYRASSTPMAVVPALGHPAETPVEVDGPAADHPGQGELEALGPLGHRRGTASAAASVPGPSCVFSQSTKVAASSVLAPHWRHSAERVEVEGLEVLGGQPRQVGRRSGPPSGSPGCPSGAGPGGPG